MLNIMWLIRFDDWIYDALLLLLQVFLFLCVFLSQGNFNLWQSLNFVIMLEIFQPLAAKTSDSL